MSRDRMRPRPVLQDDDELQLSELMGNRPLVDASGFGDVVRDVFAPEAADVPEPPTIGLGDEEFVIERPRPGFSSAGSFSGRGPFTPTPNAAARRVERSRPTTPGPSLTPAASISSPPVQAGEAASPGELFDDSLMPSETEDPFSEANIGVRTTPRAVPWSPGQRPRTDQDRSATTTEPQTRADDDEILPHVPTQDGGMRPEASPQYDPRRNAMMKGAFGPTSQEQQSLSRAQHRDDRTAQRQRRMAAAGSVLGAFGGLVPFLLPVSRGISGIAQAMPSEGQQEGRVRQQIADRMQQQQRELGYADQQAAIGREQEQQEANAQRQAAQDALAARQAEADIGLTEARTESERAEQANAAMEQAIQDGDIRGARAIFRAFVGSLNNNAEAAQMARAFIASPDFANATADDLRGYQTDLRTLAGTRHSGLLTHGGGSGAGYVQDPHTLQVRRVSRGGRRPEPTLPPTYEELQAAQEAAQQASEVAPPVPAPAAPSRPRGTGGTRAAPRPAEPAPPSPEAVQAAEATPTGDARAIAIDRIFPRLSPADRTIAIGAMLQNHYTPEQVTTDGRVQSVIAASIDRYHQAGRGAGDAQYANAIEALQRDIDPTQFAQGIDETIYRRVARRIDPIQDQMDQFATPAGALQTALRRATTPQARARIVTALNGDAAMAQMMGVPDLQAVVRYGDETYGRGQSGAAISQSEWANFRTILGHGSVITDPQTVVNALTRIVQLNQRHIERIWETEGGPGYSAEFNRQERLRRDRRRAARGGR